MFFASIVLANTANIPNPVELGQVNWLRDYDQAVAQSRQTQKPILILFQ
ncbi:MAG: thioredoxin family (seleno)protein, partial [Bacteroidota bacterium]